MWQRSNEELLAMYGFAEESNANDAVALLLASDARKEPVLCHIGRSGLTQVALSCRYRLYIGIADGTSIARVWACRYSKRPPRVWACRRRCRHRADIELAM